MRQVRGRDIAMMFQDPMTSLNPLHSIGRQMDEMLRLHTDLDCGGAAGALHRDAGERWYQPRAGKPLEAYPHQFSGGMRQRVVIAIALLAGPELIIADEPTTALDVTIQAQILNLMQRRMRERGTSMILITHDLAVVSRMVDHITVLYCGRVVEEGPKARLIRQPAHPYTRGLIGSIPEPARPSRAPEPDPGHRAAICAICPPAAPSATVARAPGRAARPNVPELRDMGGRSAGRLPLPGRGGRVMSLMLDVRDLEKQFDGRADSSTA